MLKFIGDGILAIFPVVGGTPRGACDAALRAVSAARVGMAHLDEQRLRQAMRNLERALMPKPPKKPKPRGVAAE